MWNESGEVRSGGDEGVPPSSFLVGEKLGGCCFTCFRPARSTRAHLFHLWRALPLRHSWIKAGVRGEVRGEGLRRGEAAQ